MVVFFNQDVAQKQQLFLKVLHACNIFIIFAA